jgi:hypothetical protein
MIALLVQSGGAQVILTKTNSEGSYTTGNRLDLPNKLDLFSPITYDIPLLLDTDLYKNMSKYQDYKNNWIVDISNIDPKVAPSKPGIRPRKPQLQHRCPEARRSLHLPGQGFLHIAAHSPDSKAVLRVPWWVPPKGKEPQRSREEVRKQNLLERNCDFHVLLHSVPRRNRLLVKPLDPVLHDQHV